MKVSRLGPAAPARVATVRVVHSDVGVEAGSWALTAYLAARLGPRFNLIEGHPGGGQSDVLWLYDESAPQDQGAQVMLNRGGSVHVRRAGEDRVALFGQRSGCSWQPERWAYAQPGIACSMS